MSWVPHVVLGLVFLAAVAIWYRVAVRRLYKPDQQGGLPRLPEDKPAPEQRGDAGHWPPSTEADVRAYVEDELRRTVSVSRPRLDIEFRGEAHPPFVPVSQLSKQLWWTISSPDMDESEILLARNYVLEARLKEQQFVVWFGGLGGFPIIGPREVMLPAVHIPFPWTLDLWPEDFPQRNVRGRVRDFHGPSSLTETPEQYSLGAVLSWMLEYETQHDAAYDPMVYPMSGCRY